MFAGHERAEQKEFTDSPKYLKRKVKSGHVSADYDKRDLVLTYEVEATVVGDTGKAMQTERKTHRMPLKVKLDAHTDVRAYAEQLVQLQDLIPNNKVGHVEDLLSSLKEHILNERRRADSVKKLKRDVERQKKEDRRRQRREEKLRLEEERAKEEMAKASMDDLDEYVEKLYDESTAARVAGTNMILKLAGDAGNLEDLLENEALMGALSRTLKEDFKKSIELSLSIMNVFCSFSNFSQFHPYLHSYQVGNNTMQILRWELDRFAVRSKEMQLLQQIADAQAKGEDFDPRRGKKRGEEVDMRAEHAKTKKLQRKQEKLLFVCLHVLLNLAEDDKVEKKMAKRGLVEDLVRLLSERTTNNAELLILTVTFLKKLSVTFENKETLVDLEVVEHLVKFLSCSNDTLKRATLSTLFNLSFDPMIREQMVEHSMIPQLVDLLQEKQFRAVAIRLLYHLSMDDKCKSMFTYTEVIPYVTRMLIEFPSNHVAKELAALAINITLNGRNCNLICQGNNFKHLIERAMKRKDPLLLKVVRNISRWTLSLQEEIPDPVKKSAPEGKAPNSAGSADADADAIVAEEEAARERRNRTTYKCRRLWEPHVNDLVRMLTSTDNPALLVEVLGTLGNLTPRDLPRSVSFADLIIDNDLVELIHKHLLPGFSEDDVLLEVIVLMGQFCLDAAAARVLADSPLVKLIYDLLHEKRDDAEIVLQTLYFFHRLLRHKDTGHSLLYETQMPRDVCELLSHSNKVVCVMADAVLDLIIDHDEANEASMNYNRKLAKKAVSASKRGAREQKGGRRGGDPAADEDGDDDGALAPQNAGFSELHGMLSRMIRAKRFAIHNKEWIEVIAQEDLDDLEDDDDDPGFDSAASSEVKGYGGRAEIDNYLGAHDLDDDDLDDLSTEY